jgi:hypothetical protein
VELCGLPGSGKSTLAHQMLRDGAADGLRAGDAGTTATTALPLRVVVKARLAAGEAVRRPAAARRLVAAVLASGQPSRRDTLALVVERLVVRALYRRARSRPGTWLFEEGLVQTRWATTLRARRPGVLDALVADDGPPADVVARMDTPLEVVLERLAARTSRHSRSQALPPAQMAAELRAGALLLDQLTV